MFPFIGWIRKSGPSDNQTYTVNPVFLDRSILSSSNVNISSRHLSPASNLISTFRNISPASNQIASFRHILPATHVVIPFRNIERVMKVNQDFIITGLSTAPNNESGIRISFGHTDFKTCNEMTVIEYLEKHRFKEVFTVSFKNAVSQTLWQPENPQLLAVASNNVNVFKFGDQNLIYKKDFLNEDKYNPVISLDWKSSQPGYLLTARRNAKFGLLSIEHDTSSEGKTANTEFQLPDLSELNCGARFGKGSMEKCIFAVNNFNQIVVLDERFKIINGFGCIKEILDIDLSKDDLIALRSRKQVYIYDSRNLSSQLHTYYSFLDGESTSSICWSPSSSHCLYIGTTSGRILEWKTDENRSPIKSFSQNNIRIQTLHCPDTSPNLLLSTSIDRVDALNATSIEVYSK